MVRIAKVASITCLVVSVAASTVMTQTDPAVAGQWALSAPLPFHPTAIHLLPTGMVMFYSGNSSSTLGDDPRLWDPATGGTATLPKPGYDIFCSGHAFMADGRLFFAGGNRPDGGGVPNASIYDAANNVWAAAPNMNAGRWYPTVTTLANGDLLSISGNIDSTAGVNVLPQVFQSASGTWRNLTSAQLNVDLYPRMYLAPNGKVFYAGPSATTRYLDTSGTGAWTLVGNQAYPYRNAGSSVMYDDGKILVMGGNHNPPTKTAEVIDLNAPSPVWRGVPSMAFARLHLNSTLLPDGKVLVTGGTGGPGNSLATAVYAAEIWDPGTEQWTTMASAQTPRLYHSAALLLPDGRVLTTGGDTYKQVELYSPPYLFAGARPTIASAPTVVSYGQSFFVETPDAANIASVTWIRLPSVTHSWDMNQRINRLSFSQAPGGLNVVPPSGANLAPPGHYMLFLLNGTGVPSVASIVRLDASVGGNQPPVVNAGANQTVTLPSAATLTGSATDDGLPKPPGGLTTAWSHVIGPGTVTFADSSALNTTASFSAPGMYTLRLTANDGGWVSADDVTVTVNAPVGSGTGLRAQYYNDPGTGPHFATPVLTRTDATVNFAWGTGSPGAGVQVNNFSARWTGQVQAVATGNFTFSTISDDGVRLWINGQLVIDNWTDHGPTTNTSAAVALVAGTKYNITMEYYEHNGGATAQLRWAYPGQTQVVIPQLRLYATLPPSGSISATPNPIMGCDGTVGVTTLSWNSSGVSTVEVRVGSPAGALFARTAAGAQTATTGKWVGHGMVFYLQNVTGGLPLTAANTLAAVTVTLTTVGCKTGSITANPNPVVVCDGSGRGVTTLSWSSSGTSVVEVRVGSPTGSLFAQAGTGSGTATTGKWVGDGMTFYLQDVSGGLPLTTANTLATVPVGVTSTGCF